MREIKFRAWNPVKKHMVTQGFKLHCTGQLYSDHGFVDPGDPVMQFTGLLDRSGVEIYEGDIVITEKLVVKVVEWESLTMQPFGQYFEQFDEWEVIGNIYQNPELVPK